MPSWPLSKTHGGTTSEWHATWPLGSTHDRITLGLAYKHHLWTTHKVNDVRRGMSSSPLDCTQSHTTSGVPSDHRPYPAHTVN